MQKWKYLELGWKGEWDNGVWQDSTGRKWPNPMVALDPLGNEGWELVSVLVAGPRLEYYFKRPKS